MLTSSYMSFIIDVQSTTEMTNLNISLTIDNRITFYEGMLAAWREQNEEMAKPWIETLERMIAELEAKEAATYRI